MRCLFYFHTKERTNIYKGSNNLNKTFLLASHGFSCCHLHRLDNKTVSGSDTKQKLLGLFYQTHFVIYLIVYRELHNVNSTEVCVSSSLERKEEALIDIDEALSLAKVAIVKT